MGAQAGGCRLAEELAASAFGLPLAEVRSAERGNAAASLARQTAMYLAHVHLGIRLSEVARNFRRDRTTVAHACARIEDPRDDPQFERILDCLEAAGRKMERYLPADGADMTAHVSRRAILAVLEALAASPSARLRPAAGEGYRIAASGGRTLAAPEKLVRLLASRGLVEEIGGGEFAATSAAASFLKRETSSQSPFPMQHGSVLPATRADVHRDALEDLDESPVGKLARRKGADGAAFLPEHAVAAAERLRRDFELGQLQPRITANWSASINTGRRASDGREASLTDMALAARMRFDGAMRDVGPDLAGVLVDVCCFLKGLEIVERERQWPARSAKLVLKIALESLARHYGLSPEASGRAGSPGVRHWGAEDYRPEIG